MFLYFNFSRKHRGDNLKQKRGICLIECQRISAFLIGKKKDCGSYTSQPSHAVISSLSSCKEKTLSALACLGYKIWEM